MLLHRRIATAAKQLDAAAFAVLKHKITTACRLFAACIHRRSRQQINRQLEIQSLLHISTGRSMTALVISYKNALAIAVDSVDASGQAHALAAGKLHFIRLAVLRAEIPFHGSRRKAVPLCSICIFKGQPALQKLQKARLLCLPQRIVDNPVLRDKLGAHSVKGLLQLRTQGSQLLRAQAFAKARRKETRHHLMQQRALVRRLHLVLLRGELLLLPQILAQIAERTLRIQLQPARTEQRADPLLYTLTQRFVRQHAVINALGLCKAQGVSLRRSQRQPAQLALRR